MYLWVFSLGSYAGAGYLLSTMNATGEVTDYTRWLDMDSALVRTQWTQDENTFLRCVRINHGPSVHHCVTKIVLLL